MEAGEPLRGLGGAGGIGGVEAGQATASHFQRGKGGEGAWLGAADGAANSMLRDFAGQIGCSFTHRSLASCAPPVCSGSWCHVRFLLTSPDGTQSRQLDVPWSVVYGGERGSNAWGKGKHVACYKAQAPPFDANVDCMLRTAIYGDVTADALTAPGLRKDVDCAARGLGALKGGGLLPPPFSVPLFPPPPETYSGECGMAGSFHKVADGGGAGGDFGAASVYVMVNPQTGERTGVLAVRTFVESQVNSLYLLY